MTEQLQTKNVVLFGATSYLGHFVIETLLKAGFNVCAVSRDPLRCSLLLADFDIDVISIDGISNSRLENLKPAALINLAYVKDAPAYAISKRNTRLLKNIVAAVDSTGSRRLIHVSTQAVFGYSFSKTPRPKDVRLRRDDPYIETKIQAEHLLRKWNKRNQFALSIVRLGNIIGPGSPIWTAGPAQRILEGRPVGHDGALGYSNSTFVRNAAEYICFLIQQPQDLLLDFGTYHHLAEFSHYRWSQMLEFLSGVIGKNFCVSARPNSSEGHTAASAVYKMIQRLKKGTVGSYMRAAANRLFPEHFFASVISSRLKRLYFEQPHFGTIGDIPTINEADQVFFEIVAAKTAFESHLMPGWSAPFTVEDALTEIKGWLKRAGYVIRKDQELLPDN